MPENLTGTLTLSIIESMHNIIPRILFCELYSVDILEYPELPPTENLRSRRRLALDLQRGSLRVRTDFIYQSCATKLALSQKVIEVSYSSSLAFLLYRTFSTAFIAVVACRFIRDRYTDRYLGSKRVTILAGNSTPVPCQCRRLAYVITGQKAAESC